MTIFLVFIVIVLALILWYALMGRRWLLTKPWAQGYFQTVEPIESALFKKSETILMGRLMWFSGIAVSIYDTLAAYLASSGIDFTPVTSRVFSQVPEDLRGIVVFGSLAAIGFIVNRLRKCTTKPLDIVSLPIDSPPSVAAAADKAVGATQAAVDKIQDAKDKGKI